MNEEKKKPWWKQKTLAEALGKEPPVKRSFAEIQEANERKHFGGDYFEGVLIPTGRDVITYRGTDYPLPASATVETAGELQSRVTVTRLAAFGVFAFALQKKKDQRELYLTVEGEDWAFVVDVDPKKGLQARQFSIRVNNYRTV